MTMADQARVVGAAGGRPPLGHAAGPAHQGAGPQHVGARPLATGVERQAAVARMGAAVPVGTRASPPSSPPRSGRRRTRLGLTAGPAHRPRGSRPTGRCPVPEASQRAERAGPRGCACRFRRSAQAMRAARAPATADSMQATVSARGFGPRRTARPATRPRARPLGQLAEPSTTSPTTAARHAPPGSQVGHATHDLALERLLVEEPLGGNHQVGASTRSDSPSSSATTSKPGRQRGTGRRQPAGQGAGRRPRPGSSADVDAVVGEVVRRPGARAGGAAARPGRSWPPSGDGDHRRRRRRTG